MRGSRYVLLALGAALKFRGFRGLKRLLRGSLASVLDELLAESRLRAAGVLDPRAIGRLVAEHRSGARDHARVLWSLLVFESWRTHYLGEGALV